MANLTDRIVVEFGPHGNSTISLAQYEPREGRDAADRNIQISISVHADADAAMSACGWLPIRHLDEVIAFLERARERENLHTHTVKLVGPGGLAWCENCKGGEAELYAQTCEVRMRLRADAATETV